MNIIFELTKYKFLLKICDATNSILLSDMAHISGLVAAGVSYLVVKD